MSLNLPDSTPSPFQSMPGSGTLALVFAVSLLAVLASCPTPASLLLDPDQFLQMVGAQMIARGQYPYIHFGADYGPLVFYASYFAQRVGNHSIGAELILDALGYAIAFVLIYLNTALITKRKLIPPLVLTLSLLQLPRYYKYYILLGPSLTLFSILIYLARPARAMPAVMAACIVITGLFRPDMGFYAVLAGLAAIAAGRPPFPLLLRRCTTLLLTVVLIASPWLVFLIIHHGLEAYLRDSIVVAASHARGLSLPLPGIALRRSFVGNLPGIAYWCWWCVPGLLAIVLMVRWRRLRPVARSRAGIATGFALLCLIQSAHRADFGHLLQSIAVVYVLAGFVADQMLAAVPWPAGKAMVITLAIAFAAVSVGAAITTHSVRPFSAQSPAYFRRYYFCDQNEFVRRMEQDYPETDQIKLIRFIDANTTGKEPVMLVSYLTQIQFLSDRPIAGGQMFMAPGFFTAEADQRAVIQTLQNQGNPMVIEFLPGYDGLASRTFRSFEPLVFNYLKARYQSSPVPGLPAQYVLWRRKD